MLFDKRDSLFEVDASTIVFTRHICRLFTVVAVELRKRPRVLLDNLDANRPIGFEIPAELITICDPEFTSNTSGNICLVSRDRAFGVGSIVVHRSNYETIGQKPSVLSYESHDRDNA